MGKFVKGHSGNPGGRPKTIAHLRELAQCETEQNIRTLIAIRDNKRAPFAARVAAVRELFDRGFGKATQPISGDSEMPAVQFLVISGPQKAFGDAFTSLPGGR